MSDTTAKSAVPSVVADLRDRHLGFYIRLGRQINDELDRSYLPKVEREARLSMIRAEIDNFRSAIAWAAEGGRFDEGLELLGRCGHVWYEFRSDGMRWTEWFLAHPGGSPAARGHVVFVRAEIASIVGDHQAAAEGFREAERLLEAAGDLRAQGSACRMLANALWHIDPAAGIAPAERAVALLEGVAEPWEQADALRVLGWLTLITGAPEVSRPLFAQAEALLRAAGGLGELSAHLNVQANFHRFLSDHANAQRSRDECIRLAREWGDREWLANVLEADAETKVTAGQLEEAQTLLAEVRDLARGEDDGLAQARALHLLAEVALQSQDLPVATSMLEEALVHLNAEGRTEGDLLRMTRMYNASARAEIARSVGDLEACRRSMHEAITIAGSLPFGARAIAMRTLGVFEIDGGDRARGMALLEEAASLVDPEVQGSNHAMRASRIYLTLVERRDGADAAISWANDRVARADGWLPVARESLRFDLGHLLNRAGRHGQARETLESVLASGAFSDRGTISAIEVGLALAFAALGEPRALDDSLRSLGSRWRGLRSTYMRGDLLDCVAARALATGDATTAAEVMGAAAAFRDLTVSPRPPVLDAVVRPREDAARAELGDEAFEAAYARGAGRHDELLEEILG